MSSYSNQFHSFSTQPPLGALLSFTPLSAPVRKHLANVYTILAGMMAVTVMAVQANLRGWVPQLHPMLAGICMLVSYMLFNGLSPSKENQTWRRLCLVAFAAFKGFSLTSLVQYVGFISEQIIPQAVSYTAIVFVSFSLAAMYAHRRSMLYLGGLLLSGLSVLFFSSIVRIFWRSEMLFSLELYLGLFIFAGFVIYDTQVMIYKASLPEFSSISKEHSQLVHAAELYMDLIAIFVRLVAIFAEKEGRKQKSDDDRSGEGRTRRR